jgi:hypothetical protein
MGDAICAKRLLVMHRSHPQAARQKQLENEATAVNIFDFVLTNKNKGRENEAPAESFLCSRPSIPCLWTSNGGPV